MPREDDIAGRRSRLSPARQALLEKRLRGERTRRVDEPPISRRPADGPRSLSPGQERLWFLDQLGQGGSPYNLPQAWRLRGHLEVAALERSFGEIIRRHEALRTTIAVEDGLPLQVIAPWAGSILSVADLEALPKNEREARVRQLMSDEARRPFDLARGPLMRAILYRLEECEHILLVVVHHIIFDGWSWGLLIRELSTSYDAFARNLTPVLPELPIQYADYAHWQRERLQNQALQVQLEYWKRQLAGSPPLLQMPLDHPRPPVQTFRGANHRVELPGPLSDALISLSRREGSSLFMTMLAAFNVFVHRHAAVDDVVVGVPIANRTRLETESLIGLFINTLVMRTDLSGNPSFRGLVGRVREVALAAYAHQELPFERLVEELHPERDLSFNPLFQVMFDFQNAPRRSLTLTGIESVPLGIETDSSMFDLTLYLEEDAQGIVTRFEYNTDLFTRGTIERMAARFLALLEGVAADPECRIADLPILPEAERHRVVVEWNRTRADYPSDACIHGLFEAQAERTPDATAVVCGSRRLTYRELNGRANQLAHRLIQHGVGPEVLVGVCVERSPEMLVTVLAVLKAGGAYVPLDPAFPAARLSQILEDAGVKVLVTQPEVRTRLPSMGGPVLHVDDPCTARESRENPGSAVTPDNLAYVMFTSGSTGRPKGVQVEHRAVVNLLESMGRAPGLTAEDVLVAVTTLSFDIAGLELYLPLARGARVVVAGRDDVVDGRRLAELLDSSGATVMQATPATWRMLLDSGWKGRKGMKILCGGEALPPELAAELLPLCSSLWNMYGPTETTIWSTTCRMLAAGGPVSIGAPIANTQVYVLDAGMRPVPIGVAGELYIGGDGLARGYLNRPDLTSEKFVPNPFSEGNGSRLYRTGDQCRWRDDGTLEHLGRLDTQVKVRGYRIELGDIEATLGGHPSVKECAAVVKNGAAGGSRLVAYAVCHPGQSPQPAELRQHLQERLPEYMVPWAIMILAQMPLTPNGKVDRRALPEPSGTSAESGTPYLAPRDQLEMQIVAVWQKVLKVRPIGVRDNFFDLGGHSLLAATLFAQLERRLGRKIPLATIFQAPTIEQLADIVRQKDWRPDWSSLVAIQPGGSRTPLFLVHGAEGNVLLYRELAHHLGHDQPVYGLQSRGLDGSTELARRIEDMAALYVKEVRALQPEGPYYLGGYCMGGGVALEMAQQLQAQGQEVALLAMLETNNLTANPRAFTFFYDLYRRAQNIKFHLDNLLLARSREGYRFFEHKLSVEKTRFMTAIRVLVSKLARRLNARSSSPYPHVFVSKVNDRAYLAYRPRPYKGRIVLFRPRKGFAGLDDREFGWQGMASDGVDIQVLSVYPRGMLVEPFVRHLAARLKTYLEKAEAR